MKEGWEIKRFGDVCSIINGRSQKAVECSNGEYPIYGSGGIMGRASDYLCEAGATIIGRKGSINNPIFVQTRFWNVDTAFGMLPNQSLNNKLFYYFCLSFDFTKMNKGTTIPSLVKSDLLQIEIPVPSSISEQQRIVDILDKEFAKIDTLKANAEKKLQNAKDLFQAALKKAFEPREGWRVSTIGDTCDFQNGFAFKSSTFTKTGEPIVRISDIQNNVVEDDNMVYFQPTSYREDLSRFRVFPDDILIAMSGGTTGKLGINKTGKTFYLNQRVGVFRENKKILNHMFLFYYLHTKSDESLRIAAGAAQPNLSTQQIKEYIIPVPSLDIQESIVATLDELNIKCKVLQDNYTKTLALCDDLKQSLLRKAFNGEL